MASSAESSQYTGVLDGPPCVVLPALGAAGQLGGPTVRIYLGTEAAQYRAERVFIWSVERVRNRARRYEIYLMRDLGGFDRRGWTTGFTNHRFAIPHFAAGKGRAIYNDVDQIYLADPGTLFDLDLGSHAVLAVAPDDLSVALMDCSLMGAVWTLEAAQTESKKALLAKAREIPGLIGCFDPGWNTRDASEHSKDTSKCYHFTTLHTQPWRPFPEKFVYQPHPHAELWHALERSADDAGFEIFGRSRPSGGFAQARRDPSPPLSNRFDVPISDLCRRTGARSAVEFVDTGADGGAGNATERWGVRRAERVTLNDPNRRGDRRWDAAICGGALEGVPGDDLPWVLDEIFESAEGFVFVAVSAREPGPAPNDQPPLGTPQTREWWIEHLRRASARRPNVPWELATTAPGKTTEYARGGPFVGDGSPTVWVLNDDRPGNQTQSLGLAEELGWPFETRELEFSSWARLHDEFLGASLRGLTTASAAQLEPPWPDLVIAAGRRTAPVARWIRAQSEGRTRIVQLGRKGASPPEYFDLAVAPRYARLMPHAHLVETLGPLTRVRTEVLGEAAAEWVPQLQHTPLPRIAVLVGGDTKRHFFSAEAARRLGEGVARMAKESGGSVLVTTSRRTAPDAVRALRDALPEAALFHQWSPDGAQRNPYLGLIALADVFVVTDDSESMVAEACATGRPVSLFPVEMRPPTLANMLGEFIVRRAYHKPLNHRGTTRPQRGFERLCAKLLARGIIRPPRNLAQMREDLARHGLAEAFDGKIPVLEHRPSNELHRVANRVRRLLGVAAPD